MKVFKNVKSIILLATLICAIIISSNVPLVMAMNLSAPQENYQKYEKNTIKVYSDLTGITYTPHYTTINNTTFVGLNSLAYLMGFDFELTDNDTKAVSIDDNYAFKITKGNKGAIINGNYTLMPEANIFSYISYKGRDLLVRDILVPFRFFVESFGKMLTYDANKKTYIISEKESTITQVPTYTKKEITFISKVDDGTSKTVNSLITNGTLFITIEDLREIMGLEWFTFKYERFATPWYCKDSLNPRNPQFYNDFTFNYQAGRKEVYFNDSYVLLPTAPFYYSLDNVHENIYVPVKAFAEIMGNTFSYNANAETAIIS